MTSPKTIAHIITGLDTGGAEMMLYKLLSRTDASRFRPVVISLRDHGTLGRKIEQLGIPVHAVGMKAGLPLPRQVAKLIKIVRSVSPDLLQGWMYHGNLACHLASRNVPVVWNIRGSHYDLRKLKKTTAAVVWLGARLSRLPLAIVNNSRESARKHTSRLGYPEEKFKIIPNGFDTNVFVPSESARRDVRSELGLPEDARLIGLIARYHPVKDHANFLRAAAKLLNTNEEHNVSFLLIGRDVEMLQEHVNRLGIGDRLFLLGERPDVQRLTAALDIATLCSKAEGFPNVIGEAMSCGVPCVVTDVGDAAWIVGTSGIAVQPENSDELEAAWRRILEMDEGQRRKMGETARLRIQETFSLETVVKQYEALYDETLAIRRKAAGVIS